jgi:hypothetical protein
MFFIVDNNIKIIFGWSAKCGCSHIKYIYWFLQTNNLKTIIHTKKEKDYLPSIIENYVTLIFCRNPYKRIVSGFLDKYKKNGEHRDLWTQPTLTFAQFVDELIKNNWKIVDKHHFTPQTTEHFNKKILLSKIIKFYDISNIDYAYIEQLYNKKIPEYVLKKPHGHERVKQIKTNIHFDKYVYDLHIDDYIDYNIDIKYFYNEEIKEKIFKFYINDFNFFYENGIDYITQPL